MSLVLAASLLILTGTAPDTLADPVPAYAPVLADLRAKAPAPPGLPLVLHARMYSQSGSGPVPRMLPSGTLRRLQDGGWVDSTCEGVPGSPGCPRPGSGYISVNLGRVIELDRTVRVKVAPEKRIPGRTFEEVMAAIPDSLAVPVDATVDAVIGTPCPEPPGSLRCRTPDVDVYRYFLRRAPEGTYRVITRYLIGGA